MGKTKSIFKTSIALATIALFMPQAHAAKYRLRPNTELIKGCSGVIEIEADTEGASILAGDASLIFNSSEFDVHQVNVGNALPMQVYEQISGNTIQVSGARFPQSGTFTGVDTFAYISVTPKSTASSGTISFSADILNDNNLVTDSIQNVLNDAIGSTYNFKNPYNGSYCTPDLNPPTAQFVTPLSGSADNQVDTDIVVVFSDNRVGVDADSIIVTVNGQAYNPTSQGVTIVESGGLVRFKINPASDFSKGQQINLDAYACDLNLQPNCDSNAASFRIVQEAPPAPVCGDGVIQQGNGEQCDDGNNVNGDGCSLLCLLEVPQAAGATCTDGLHNQGEAGIDCGGPCSNACPTCVDNIRNQGEENVDCGGPCPSCSKKVDKLITICHYPVPSDRENAYSLVIPENQLVTYQLSGDTVGPCTIFDQCPQALLLAAPEREREAVRQAIEVIEQGVVSKSKVAVDLPTEIVDQIELCRTNPDFEQADLNSPFSDVDEDGLTDRVECYGGTHPSNPDTDGDGCTDFDELNNYHTNPTEGSDCVVEQVEDEFLEVLITDPKPSWVVSTDQPTIGGKIPYASQFVLGIATPAQQSYILNLSDSIRQILTLRSNQAEERVNTALENMSLATQEARAFVAEVSGAYNYDILERILEGIPQDLSATNLFEGDNRDELEKVRFDLLSLSTEPVTSIAVTEFEETNVSDLPALNFEQASAKLQDKTLYDLVVVAYLNDGSRVESKAIRFGVDTSTSVNKPIPRTISGKSISDSDEFSFTIGGKAYAQSDDGPVEIEIKDQKPLITGETEFGSNVFAIWHSVVLASSVISDSEQGAFQIQAPRALELDSPHRATLYAVKTLEDGRQIRSDNVDVYFRIKKTNFAALAGFAAAAAGAMAGATYFLRGRIFRRRYGIRIK